MNYDFRVGVRTKTMPLSRELTAQIGEVVDLAVVGDPHRPIFVAHGHVAIGGKVEDGKTAAPQSDVSPIGEMPLPEPRVVGTAMGLHVRHPDERVRVSAVHESADAAHDLTPSRSAARRSWPWNETSAPPEKRSRSAPARHREIPDEKHNGTGRAEPESPASDRDFARAIFCAAPEFQINRR